ncbi:MAG: hypothetical protein FJ358_01480 [Thaumarchaeota archaeon]|nr:hypothetical protein [Nitrososphaerota archaeon]
MLEKRIIYELDPPHLLGEGPLSKDDIEKRLEVLRSRVDLLERNVDSILITDSVLGIPRVPAIYVADHLVSNRSKKGKSTSLMCTLRTCDHSVNAIIQMVFQAMISGIDGILFVKGDPPRFGGSLNPEAPSKVVDKLREIGFKSGQIKFYLATPTVLNKKDVDRKIAAGADGLVTQIIRTPEEMKEISSYIADRVPEVIGTVLVPTEANAPSAKMFDFDVSLYSRNPANFVSSIMKHCTGVLVTSPRSFDDGLAVVRKI